ncbi:hypothetical protein GCM10011369_12750 [Neiella marina]|uniref:DUF2306 domain-containing protein n=1 Tax=Neiella marina TaxID=508461 RepID=A0A8J2U404_9GAMM|nr:DUF2306 domain-containing protein [Neiella marina]GGA72429.1 hypothetical protein GCM10011369_12750 [Neiella marina]
MTWLGFIHLAFATVALVLGVMLFRQAKGGKVHRSTGYLYSLALLILNVSALGIYSDSQTAGPFHVLAFVSLATLFCALTTVFVRRPRSSWLRLHAYFMCWSYVGLVSAGCGQIIAMLQMEPMTIGLVSASIVALGGVIIHFQLPNALNAISFAK